MDLRQASNSVSAPSPAKGPFRRSRKEPEVDLRSCGGGSVRRRSECSSRPDPTPRPGSCLGPAAPGLRMCSRWLSLVRSCARSVRVLKCNQPASWLKTTFFTLAAIMGLASLCPATASGYDGERTASCLVVTGLGGVAEYEENFRSWGEATESICRDGITEQAVLLDGSEVGRDQVLRGLDALKSTPQDGQVWLFLIGHASHDGRQYKFNIKGPDLTGDDLKQALDELGTRRTFVIAATSSSGVLAEELSGENRVIVTATQSARERHAPLFMSFFVEAAHSAVADRNKDGRVSINEAFTFSEAAVKEWYEGKGRLQTEHPVLRDGADGAGLASMAYLSSPPEQAYRTLEAQELAPQRIRLEREIEDLKLRKTEMETADYYKELERLLLELADLNDRIRKLEGEE